MKQIFEFDIIADKETLQDFQKTYAASLISCAQQPVEANQARSYSASYVPEMITAISASATFALELAKFIADRFARKKADKITVTTRFTGPMVFREGEHDQLQIEQEISQVTNH